MTDPDDTTEPTAAVRTDRPGPRGFGPDAPEPLSPADAELIARIQVSKSADRFDALWRGDPAARDGDAARADYALCKMLAFWAAKDAARIDRLFRRSGLMRAAWDDPRGDGTYGAEVIARAVAATTDVYTPADRGAAPDGGDDRGRGSVAGRLVELAHASGIELFHDESDTAYAGIRVNDHTEVHPLESDGFMRWLELQYYRADGKAANRDAAAAAVNLLGAEAKYDGPEHAVHLRTAPNPGGGIVLDLGDDAWRAVVVTAGGWEVVEAPPVRFRRGRAMRPLPAPERGGRFDELRRFVRVKTDDDWLLAAAWAVAAVFPTGPFAVAHLKGEQGASKTTSGTFLRRLTDPNDTPFRGPPDGDETIAVAARNAWAIYYDNLSDIKPWLSDALCRVATGDGFARRALFTDFDERTFAFCRPVLVTSIGDVIDAPDLLDRCVPIELARIPDHERRTRAEIEAAFDAAAGRMFGGFLDLVAGTLARLPEVQAERPPVPRMADFAYIGEAACRVMGRPPGTFLAAFRAVRTGADQQILASCPFAVELYRWVERRGAFTGTYSTLFEQFAEGFPADRRRAEGWPKNAQKLSEAIGKIGQTLQRMGVRVTTERHTETRAKIVTLRYEPPAGGGLGCDEAIVVGAPPNAAGRTPDAPSCGGFASEVVVHQHVESEADAPDGPNAPVATTWAELGWPD